MENEAMPNLFLFDLNREQQLGDFLDKVYLHCFDSSRFHLQRAKDLTRQHQGTDLVIVDRLRNCRYHIDEKAQLDYINKTLPTFAFELSYLKSGVHKKGWLLAPNKKTDCYFLITSIQQDKSGQIMGCRVVSVHCKKLWALLNSKGLSGSVLMAHEQRLRKAGIDGKIVIPELDAGREGYLYYTRKRKIESPINLVIRINYLMDELVGKVVYGYPQEK